MSPMLSSILEQMESQPGVLDNLVISSGASMAISRIRYLERAIELAEYARNGLSRYADRAREGEVDAGSREFKRQVLLKFQDFDEHLGEE